ncbi:MAG TPA: peptidoglycan editing factor PgeF [Terriglobales bacterium]|nr:peptidoglycan editing factor PgeF [Terriglobales bacterium]
MIEAAELSGLTNIRHGFMTRGGGVSAGIYATLNCGIGSWDATDAVLENRGRAVAKIGMAPASLVTAYQVHSAKAVVVEQPWARDAAPQVDGMVTAKPGVTLGILTADCAPVLFADEKAGVIGAAHAGWKGAITGVLQATVEKMVENGAKAGRIRAAIGPCIGQMSYEVGAEFPAPFLAQDPAHARYFIPSIRDQRYMFDLGGYVRDQLRSMGLAGVELLGRDTCAEEEQFFSYRRTTLRQEPDYGRQISLIGLSG